ncbi:MAG: GspMb/PilO family protein [bacterium]
MKHQKVNKIKLVIIIVLILTLYLFGWFRPELTRYVQINNLLCQKQKQLEKYPILLSNKDEYKNQTLLLKNELKKIKDKLYVSETPLIATSQFLTDIETISKSTNANVLTKNILPTKKTGKYHHISVMLNLQTNSSGLTNFLYAIKTSKKLYSIPYLNILPQKDNKLRVALIISSYMVVRNRSG